MKKQQQHRITTICIKKIIVWNCTTVIRYQTNFNGYTYRWLHSLQFIIYWYSFRRLKRSISKHHIRYNRTLNVEHFVLLIVQFIHQFHTTVVAFRLTSWYGRPTYYVKCNENRLAFYSHFLDNNWLMWNRYRFSNVIHAWFDYCIQFTYTGEVMVWDVGDHLIDRIYRELTGEQFCTISKNSNFHAVVVIWAKRIKTFISKVWDIR